MCVAHKPPKCPSHWPVLGGSRWLENDFRRVSANHPAKIISRTFISRVKSYFGGSQGPKSILDSVGVIQVSK